MNNATPLRARVARINADYPTTQDDTCATALRQSDGGEAVSESRLSDSEKRRAIDRAAAAVERAFLEWHRSGCMASAAEYTRARNVWCEMLMKWGAV